MDDLKLIKKHYGENMMKLCRELFPTLIEQNKLYDILVSNFYPSKQLFWDIRYVKDDFKNYIFNKVNSDEEKVIVDKTPQQLLNEVGYDLFECKTEEEIQKFKKYYSKGEELCTFKDNRLNRCYVFFAVKKNVDEIKRENFDKPERQDEYGTSVISIQFSRGEVNTLSIKNRYNHNVSYPDSTFCNNLENIIPGLTNSFEEKYNLNINSNIDTSFYLHGYIRANDGRYYKENYEINNIHYCEDNIIIDNDEVIKYDKEKYILIDYFILNLVDKKIEVYDDKLKTDSFIDSIGKIEKIDIKKDRFRKYIKINNKISLSIHDNRLNTYTDNEVKKIGNDFLHRSEYLSTICLTSVKEIGDNFLRDDSLIEFIYLPNVKKIGDDFGLDNKMSIITLENVEEIGNSFLYFNKGLNIAILPKLRKVKDCFLNSNLGLDYIDLPNLKEIGNNFMNDNKHLTGINLPSVEKITDNFLFNNNSLESINLPNVKEIGNNFLYSCTSLKNISIPKTKTVGSYFLRKNTSLEHAIFNHFLPTNETFLDTFRTNDKEATFEYVLTK